MYISKKRLSLTLIIITTCFGMLSYIQQINNSLAYFIIIVIMLTCSVNLLVNLKKQELINLINHQSIICMHLIVIILIQIINGLEGEVSITDALKIALYPLSFLYACILVPNFLLKNNYKDIFLKFLIYPGTLLSILTLIISSKVSLTYGAINLPNLQTAQFYYVHSFLDSNYQGAVVAVSTVSCIFYLFQKKENKIFYSSILFVNITNLIVLASRASLLAVVLCFLLAIILYISKEKKYLILLSLAIGGIIFLYFKKTIEISPLFYYNIFDAERGSTGRLEIWKEILEKSSNKLLTGSGSNTIEISSLGPYVDLSSSHNSFIDFLSINGLIALLIYVIVIINGVRKSMYFAKNNAIFIVLICIFILMNFTTHNLGGISYVPQVFGILLGLSILPEKEN